MKIKNLSLILILAMILSALPFAASAAVGDPYDNIAAANFDASSNSNSVNKSNRVAISRNASDWICYKNVDFSTAPYGVAVAIGLTKEYLTNNQITFRLDSPKAEPFAIVYVTECADWNTPVENIGTVTQKITGKHDVYVSSNQPNDIYYFYFQAKVSGEMTYTPYESRTTFADMADNSAKNEVEILNGLGIVSEYENGLFYPDLPMVRGVFANWLAHFMTDEVPTATSNLFTDIDDYQYKDEICYLYDNGLLKLNEDCTFNPYSFITVREASAMVIRLLGYEQMTDYKGGWPSGYDNVARSLGLISGMAPNDYLRRGPAAKILYNAIDAEYLDASSVKNDNISYERKTGILGVLRNLYKGKDIVTATVFSGLTGDINVPDSSCFIGNEKFKLGEDVSVEHYLGVKCEYYYYSDDNGETKTLVYIKPSSKTEMLSLNSKDVDFTKITADKIIYKDENGKKKEISLNSTVNWIYNNKALDKDIEDIIKKASEFKGTMRLVDNGNGYETVYVENYKNIKIQSVNTATSSFSDAISGENWNFTNKTLLLSDGKQSVKLSKLSRGQLVELYLSDDGEFAVVLTGETKLTGEATQITKKGKVVINGIEYNLANECEDEIVLGVTTDFYLNRHNEIVYTEINSSTKAYGLLDDVKEENDEVIFSIVTGTDKLNTFTAAKKIWFDGVRCEGYDEIKAKMSGLSRYTVVLYRTNENKELEMIDTPLDGNKDENDTLTTLISYEDSGNYLYRGGLGAMCPQTPSELSTPVKSSTPVIVGRTRTASGADFKFITASATGGEFQKYAFYSFTRDNKIADLLYTPYYTRYMTISPPKTFIEYYTSVDDYGNTGYTFEFAGNQTYFVPTEKTDITAKLTSLNTGDLVRLETDSFGDIIGLEFSAFRTFEAKNEAGYSASVSKNSGTSGSTNWTYNHVFGTVTDIVDGYIVVTPFGSTKECWISAGSTVVLVDSEDNVNSSASVNAVKMGDIAYSYISYSVQSLVVYEQ